MTAFLKTGEVHSPFFVFIHHSPRPSDKSILKALGCRSYRLVAPGKTHHDGRHLVIGHTEEWTVVADDYYYTLWHSEKDTHKIESYVQSLAEAFVCRWPDVDETFSFSYWKDGECVRSYALVQDGWVAPIRREESGERLPIETDELASMPVDEQLRLICKELGYVAADAIGSFRVYEGPKYVGHPDSGESEYTIISR